MTIARKIFWGGGVGLASAAVALIVWGSLPLPPGITAPAMAPGLTLEDRHGLALRSTRASDGSLNYWVPLAEMDPDLLAAFIAAEDWRFYQHHGIDPRALARAARDGLRAGQVVSGGSTITMQLARLLQPIDRSWTGKFRQMVWATRLEHHLDKATILEQYLNRVPLGQGAVGVPAAARLYFGAPATDLSLGQAALLAGLARAPSGNNPFVSHARAASRRTLVLRQLQAAGYATADEISRAGAEPLRQTHSGNRFLAPHFTTRILEWLEREGDPAGTNALRDTYSTSLDLPLQTALEAEVRHTVDVMKERGGVHAAAVVLENRTGEVLAWIGSPDFWADTAGQVDMVTSARQPGSTLKPFLYGLAFDRGYSAASILADVARTYQTSTGPYAPRNYDRRFHGPVRAREALGSSYNLPAVALAHRVGVSSLLHTLHLAGFSSLDRGADYYGLGLALGNGDVTLLELANAYRSLANGGVWRPFRWRASAPAGSEVEPGRRVTSERSAALVLDILSDPAARIPGFGLDTPFDFPFRAAAKTGTSRHFTDNWAVAVTGGFTVAVWVGNFSGRPMEGVSGVTGAGPLLQRAVLLTARQYPPGELRRPQDTGAQPVVICRLSGLKATADCPQMIEWFTPGSAPTADCSWHRGNEVALPLEYAEWARQNDQPRLARAALVSDRRDTSGFRIVSPQDGDLYRLPPGVENRYATIGLQTQGAGASAVRWFIDGRPTSIARWPLARGTHLVRAEAEHGKADEVRVVVE